MNASVYALPGVDYAEKGIRLEIAVEGRVRPQTVIYSGLDFQGEKWYYTICTIPTSPLFVRFW